MPFPTPLAAAAPVSISVLALSASIGPVATPIGNRPRGLPLRQWIDTIEASYAVPVLLRPRSSPCPSIWSFPAR